MRTHHSQHDGPSPFAEALKGPPTRSPKRRIPRRTDDIVLRDRYMREIVDPKKLLKPYELNEEDVRVCLSREQMMDLVQGLQVKLRAVGSPRMSASDGVGPGAYELSPPRSTVGPRWVLPTTPSAARRDVEHRDVPGPGHYNADPTLHKAASPRFSFGRRLEDKITTESVRRPVPGPGAYELPPVIGVDAPSWSMQSRRAIEMQHDATFLHPGPATYNAPSTFSTKGTVQVWSPAQPTPRAARPASQGVQKGASPPSRFSRKPNSASPRAKPSPHS